jgi:hypothetical protein
MQAADRGAQLIHGSWRVQRQPFDVLAGVRLLIDLQRWNAQRRTPQPVVERRTHRAFQHALQQLVGEIAAKVCRRRNDGEGADVVGTLARFQQKHREIDDG